MRCKELYNYIKKRFQEEDYSNISVCCGKLSEDCIKYLKERGITAEQQLFGYYLFKEASP